MFNELKKINFERIYLSFVIGSLFVFFFSYSTSPYFTNYVGQDAGVFKIIGRAWLHGKIPYKDLFDHKGPFVFFINMLGFFIGGDNKVGVFIIQIIFMTLNVLAIINISELVTRLNFYKFIILFISLSFYKFTYSEGNRCEEYVLPFILWSHYHILKFYGGGYNREDPKISFLYGVTFGVCLMTKFTSLVSIGAFVLGIYILIFIKKNYANLFINSIYFITGLCIVVIPFIVYFHYHQCLYDMIKYSILFQLDYAKSFDNYLTKYISVSVINDLTTRFWLFFSMFFCLGYNLVNKKYYLSLFYFVTIIASCIMLIPMIPINNGVFRYYTQIFLGHFIMSLNYIKLLYESKKDKLDFNNFVIIFSIFFVVAISFKNVINRNITDQIYVLRTGHTKDWEEVIEDYNIDSNNIHILMTLKNSCNYYLLNNITPKIKFWYAVNWFLTKNSDIYNSECEEELYSINAQYVLTDHDDILKLHPILQNYFDNYELINDNGKYFLYKHKEKEIKY